MAENSSQRTFFPYEQGQSNRCQGSLNFSRFQLSFFLMGKLTAHILTCTARIHIRSAFQSENSLALWSAGLGYVPARNPAWEEIYVSNENEILWDTLNANV